MKKDLKFDKIYLFSELPLETQKDFLVQYENELDFNQHDYFFCLRKIPYTILLEEFDSFLGPNLLEEIECEYVIQLARDIEANGLNHPPIGSEGIHRSLAHLYLKKDLLRFEIIAKSSLV